MIIKVLKAMAIVGAVSALVACGGKDKKEDTTPEPQTAAADPEPADGPSPEPEKQPEPSPEPSPDLSDTIYFEFDSSDLTDESREMLQENAEWLKADSSRKLTIEGHTDETGTSEYNLALGERRARATKEYLKRLGIDESRLEIVTFGEERPASEQDDLNRRSVFVDMAK